MSSLLSPAQSPAHVEIIGLNTFAASSGPQHQVSIGIWGGGQMTGQQWKKIEKEKRKKKRDKEKRKKEVRVAFTMQSESFKMICLGVGTASTGHTSPGVQLPSTFVLMSSSIHLQSHPSWPGSPIPHHSFIKEAMTPHYKFKNRNTKLKLPAGVKGPKAEG